MKDVAAQSFYWIHMIAADNHYNCNNLYAVHLLLFQSTESNDDAILGWADG